MRDYFNDLLRSESGITLLEVMIAMIILAFGVLGLAPMITVSMYGNAYSNQVSVANALALDWLEEIESWHSISPVPFSQTVTGVNGIFTRQTQIDDQASDPTVPAGVYRIRVIMSWTDHEQVHRTTSYYSYKAKM